MDYERKKKINEKICLIKDKELYHKIFEIAKSDLYLDDGKQKFTQNNNGIFFDLNNLSNETLIKIENLLADNLISLSESDIVTSNVN